MESLTSGTQTSHILPAPSPRRSWSKQIFAFIAGVVVSVVCFRIYEIATTPVAAIVNGTRITVAEFERDVAMMEKGAALQGIDVNEPSIHTEIRTQALNNLVMNELLLGAARRSGAKTDDASIQKAYTELAESVGGEEELLSRMETVGLSRDTLMDNITARLLVDAYLEANTDIESLTVTDDEVQTYIASMESAGITMPPLEEIKPDIEASLLAEKQQELMNTHIEELKNKADITIKLADMAPEATNVSIDETGKAVE